MPETNFPQMHIPTLCAGIEKKNRNQPQKAQQQIIFAHEYTEPGNEPLTQNQKQTKRNGTTDFGS